MSVLSRILLAPALGALVLGAATQASALTCQAPPAGMDCGSGGTGQEFRSCGMTVNGVNRHYCIHVPERPRSDLPVVFGFHGGGGEASRMTKIWDKHTEQGMVLVAPSAQRSGPGGGNCSRSWRHLGDPAQGWGELLAADGCSGGNNGDDLDFVAALVSDIEQSLDTAGFYAAGFSNGGGMVFQLLITEPHVSRFEGFAAVSMGINSAKIAAQAAAAGAGPYRPNASHKRPFLYSMGTGEKLNFSRELFIELVDGLLVPSNRCPAITSASIAVGCWKNFPMEPGLRANTMITTRKRTLDWLVAFNNSVPRALESLYPDVGHGDGPLAEHDATVTVRQEFPASLRGDSEPVVVLTIIDGNHEWPGKNGDHAPCGNQNCDIDLTEVILQFWRAHAGLRSQLP